VVEAAPVDGPGVGAGKVSTWPLSVVVAAVAVTAGFVKVVTTYGRPFWFYGDEAVLGLRVIDAAHLHALVGPYSRFGWSHPGPALFYVLAPVYALSGHDPRSLTAGAVLINGACLVVAIVAVRHFAGEWSARWSVGVVSVAVLALGLDFFATFWNPTLEASAVLLAAVLAAGAVAGSGASVVWLAVVGTYVVQTDVGTVPLVGLLAVTAVVGWTVQTVVRVRARRAERLVASMTEERTPTRSREVGSARLQAGLESQRRSARVVLTAIGLVAVVLLWIPPIHQQLTGRPGNLAALWDFFTSPHLSPMDRTHALADAWSVVANTTTTVPWGNPAASVAITHATYQREVTVVVWMVLGLVAIGWGAWRRRWFALGLGVASLGGLAVSVYSAERIVGPVSGYLVYWMALLPAPAVVAVGDLAIDELRRVAERRSQATPPRTPAHARRSDARRGTGGAVGRTVGAWVLAAVLVAPALGVAWVWARGTGALAGTGDPEIGQLAAFADAHLRGDSSGDVHVVIGNADRWPEAAGLILELRRRGYHPTVDSTWGFMFTESMVSTGAGGPQLVVADGVAGTAPTTGSATEDDGDVPTSITFVPGVPTG